MFFNPFFNHVNSFHVYIFSEKAFAVTIVYSRGLQPAALEPQVALCPLPSGSLALQKYIEINYVYFLHFFKCIVSVVGMI